MSEDIQYRVWVGCLESYNDGNLVGDWIDLEGHDEETLIEAIQEVIRGEEWGFFDRELPFYVGQYEPLELLFEKVEAYKKLLEQYPPDLVQVFANDHEDWYTGDYEISYYAGDGLSSLGWDIAEALGIDMENNPFAAYMTYAQWENWIECELGMTVVHAGYDTVFAYEIL